MRRPKLEPTEPLGNALEPIIDNGPTDIGKTPIPEPPELDISIIDVIRDRWDSMNWKTTWAGIAKVVFGITGALLASAGLSVTDGTLVLAPGTGPLIIVLVIAHYVASATQAYLSADRDGATSKTTWIGLLKAASGILATVLVAMGATALPDGTLDVAGINNIAVLLLYGLSVLLSGLQAYLTKDREKSEDGIGIDASVYR